MTRFVAFVGSLSTALLVASFLAVNHAPAQNPGNSHHPDEVIIGFKANASSSEKDQIRSELGGPKVKGFGRIKAELRKLEGMSVDEAVARYKNHPKVKYIEPNYIVQATEIPNDPRFSQLWGMNNTGQTGGTAGADISATSAWDVFTGSDQVLIGVIDTGVDWNHEDLAANIFVNPGEIPGNGVDDDNNGYIDDVNGWDFVNNDNNPMDDNGHGTHVSGTLGGVGDNGIGVAGVSWTVRILPLKFLSANGFGSTAGAIEAVEYATMMGVHLTNNSWGGGGFSQALEDAIAEAGNQGQLFVAASGNGGTNNDQIPHYPSSYELDNIIAVASTNHNDLMAGNSGYGLTSVDLAAPGVSIHSSFPGNTYGTISGTSMATPHVSGALGLVFGRFPGIGHLDAKALILNSADPLPNLSGLMVTGARLNVFMAIADPDSTPPDAITDLAIPTAGSNWLAATWTATGDDGSVGTASRYEIRYSELPITEANFGSAALVANPPDPGPAGTPQSTQVGELDFNTLYYVAIRAIDEFGNASPISNVSDGTTLGAPDAHVDPTSLTESLVIGETSTQFLTLSNLGEGTLDFVIPGPELVTTTPQQAQYTELGKGELDTRAGGPVIEASGGPDGFGYRWTDSDSPFGPTFNWFDISGPGTIAIASSDDSNVGPFDLGFTISYYGAEYDQVRISSNGFLSFTSASAAFSNQPLPTPSAPLNMVAPFWDDLVVSGGNVYYYNDGNRFIVQWQSVDRFGGGGPYTFQAILYEHGTIEFQYLSMPDPINGATVGMQNATGTDALQMAFNTDYVHNNLAVRIQSVPPWLSVSPTEGTIFAPGSVNLDVAFDPSGLLGGTYQATIRILSNDPGEPELDVPVTLTVIGAPDIAVSPSAHDFGQAFLGATPSTVVTINNPGTDSLHVTAIASDNPAFTTDASAIVVPPRESRPVVVTFSPTVVGIQNGILSITSDDPDSPLVGVALTGEGVTPPIATLDPEELQYDLLSNQNEAQQVQLGNQGESDLTFSVDFAPPPVPPAPGAKIAVHTQTHALKSALICIPNTEGGALPSTTPCTDYVTAATTGNRQDVYLVVTGVEEGEGVAGLSCGIEYNGAPGQGVDVRDWVFCGSGLQFPSDTWPASASGNRMTWLLPGDCQNDELGDQGVHAVFGAFYVYAYGPDTFSITENNTLAGGPELAYANCMGAQVPIAVPALGSVEFSASGDADGHNPCVGGIQIYGGPELAKGMEDHRIGEPVIHATGGPDAFGHTWVDSDAPNGPIFDWVEISGIGTPVPVQGVDGNSGPVPIGFPFSFYGNTFSDVRVCTNGWLSFTSNSAQYTNQPLPATFAPENLLAVFWDDLVFSTQQAYSYNDGSRFIVQFQNVHQYIGGGGPYTFQVILYPNGTIVYQYLSMNGTVASSTVGIQNAARDDGLTVAFNTSYLHDNLAVRFSTQPQWVSIDPLEGLVPPSGSIPLDITADATGLFGGLYEAEILIRTNDPLNPELDLPITLNVTATPDIFLPETALDYGERFIDGTWDLALSVHNTGTAPLGVSSISSSDPAYSVSPDAFPLVPGESREVVVSFRPTDPRAYPATLTLASNDPDTPTVLVTLSGTGVVPPDIDVDPDSLTEDLLSGQTSTQAITIDNVGLSDLELTISAGFLEVSSAPPVADSPPPRVTTLGDGIGGFDFGDAGSSGPPRGAGPVLDSRDAGSDDPVIAQPVVSGDDPLILIIQDTAAWGVTMSQFIFDQFGLSSSVINASQVAGTSFSTFDLIITVGDESNAYYGVISSNREKFENFVMGGGIVQYQLATQGSSLEIAGGALITYGGQENENTVLLPEHPLVEGLPTILFGNSANHTTISNLPAGAEVITETRNSHLPTTAQYSLGAGHVIATGMTWEYLWNNGFNSGPLLYNAVAHSLQLIGPQWLSVDITEATVPPGQSIQVEVGFDADALLGGDYSAELVILSNDPDESDVRVPVSLHVTGAPAIVLSTESLDFGSPFLGASRTQSLLVTNAGTDELQVSELTLSDLEYSVNITGFSLPPGEVQPVSVTFSPITPGQHPGILTLLSNDPFTPSAEVTLVGEGLIPPLATLDPAALESNLLTNRSETLIATLGNEGESDLTFQIDFLPGAGPPDTSGPPVAGPKIAVHSQGHAAKSAWTCLPVEEGGLMPTTTPCSSYITEANTHAELDIYITVAGVDPNDGVAGVAFGVDYNGASGQGVDILSWTGCESGLEFQSNSWPDPGSGNLVTWILPDDCQNTDLPPDGAHAIVGAMYIYAYSPDTFRITEHQERVTPLLAYATCFNEERSIPLSNVGSIRFSAGASEPGFNPCTGGVAVNEDPELAKGETDTRIGDPVTLGTGGPDSFGYRWIDSDEPGGPVFNWVEISEIGIPVPVTGNDANSGPLPIGFTFPFYGNSFTTFRVCTNGWISFTSSAAHYSNQPLPATFAPENLLAIFWDDLNLSGSLAYYHSDGTRLIVQYQEIYTLYGEGPYTFQTILYPSGRVVYQYLEMDGVVTGSTVGIQNAGRNDGLTVAFNTNYLHDNLAVSFSTRPEWLAVEPVTGTVPPGGSLPLQVTTDATGLFGGTYGAEIFVNSNDPVNPSLSLPITLNVTDAPDLDLSESLLDFGNVFLGYPETMMLVVTNVGTAPLSVLSITSDLADFTATPTAFDLVPSVARLVTVSFSPQAEGIRNGTLTLYSDDVDSPHTVSLTGIGVDPPVASIDPEFVEGAALPGKSKTKSIAVMNDGGSDLLFSLDAVGPPPPQPTVGPKVAVHNKSHALKGAWICMPETEGGQAPTTLPCSEYVTSGDLLSTYDVYLVMAGADSEGIGGLSCGIQYNDNPGQGTDVIFWSYCGDGLQFPSDTPSWPSSGSGNRMTWISCQDDILPPDGGHAIAGAFYVYTYGSDSFTVTENLTLQSGPELVYVNCNGEERDIPATAVGSVRYSSGASQPGFNPCEGGVLVYGVAEQPKATDDGRIGFPVLDRKGGPDGSGYSWVDSGEPGGPAFDWVDISGIGTPVAIQGDDENSGPLPIGFEFPFYENEFTTFRVCTNGWISFTSSSRQHWNPPLPATNAPEGLLAVFFDDLIFSSQQAYFHNDGNRMIVQYQDVYRLAGDGPFTFQVILSPDGSILYQYLSMGGSVTSSTVGIQNGSRDTGLTVAFNTPYLMNNLAIRFSNTPLWLDVTPTTGVVSAGQSLDLGVFMDAANLNSGDFTGTIGISTNDPASPRIEADVVFHVGSVDAADFDVDPNTLNLGSNGKWITAKVELPSPYLPEQVLVETVLLNDLILADPEQVSITDFNENGVPDLTFKFDRELVEGILPEGDSVAVTVTGEIEDQTHFVGMDYIRAIHPQLMSPNGGDILLSGTFVEVLWENPPGWQVETAALTYSEDAGATWSLVADGITQNAYIWRVPPTSTETALLRVHVYDDLGMLGYDSSDDVFQITSSVTGAQSPTPTVHALLQNAPNPFRSQSLIAFDLPVESDVKLQIFDVTGRVVRTLEDRFLPAGRHQLVWNGRDDGGREVGAGIYFYRIQAGPFVASRRMSLLR